MKVPGQEKVHTIRSNRAEKQRKKAEVRASIKRAQEKSRAFHREKALRKAYAEAAFSGKPEGQKHWESVAEALRGTEDHLLVVSNFDGSEATARKIAVAIEMSGFDPQDLITFSVHTTDYISRKPEGFSQYSDSAQRIGEALENIDFTNINSNWLPQVVADTGSVAQAIEQGVREAKDEKYLSKGLHVAVVSGLNMEDLDVPYGAALYGEAYLYRGSDPDRENKPSFDKIT